MSELHQFAVGKAVSWVALCLVPRVCISVYFFTGGVGKENLPPGGNAPSFYLTSLSLSL
jgi:hypothetical protein